MATVVKVLRPRQYINAQPGELGIVADRAVDKTGPLVPCDFIAGPVEDLPDGEFDRYGWRRRGNIVDGRGTPDFPPGRIAMYRGAVRVLRYSMGVQRYHVLIDDNVFDGSYHCNDAWLARHIGERLTVLVGDMPLDVDVRWDVATDEHIKEPCVLLNHLYGWNYAHTLLETLPRLWFLDSQSARVPSNVRYVWDCEAPFQRELAEMFLPGAHIVRQQGNCTAFRELYIPGFFPQVGTCPAAIAWLREKFSSPNYPGKKKIYISRGDAARRRVLNEPAVIALLARYGFEVHRLADATVSTQRRLFGEAGVVVMPHGAAAVNMVFAGRGAKLIEFLPESYQHHMYQHVTKWSGQWYGRLICAEDESAPSGPTGRDFVVDLNALAMALEAAGI